MDTQELNQKKIDGIDFIKKIDKEIEDDFIENYKKLNIAGLTESFLIDLKIFEEILSDNEDKLCCKFYFIQQGTSLNLGLSFSDNEECPIKINNRIDDDILYILENDSIVKKDFRDMKNDFMEAIGSKLPTHPENKKDTLISYPLKDINSFLHEMKNSYPNIDRLKFNMFQYSPNNINPSLSAHFTKRDKRIAFCVHVLFNKRKASYDQGDGYDLGNLRP